MPVGYCIAIAYLHKTTRFYMLTNAREYGLSIRETGTGSFIVKLFAG